MTVSISAFPHRSSNILAFAMLTHRGHFSPHGELRAGISISLPTALRIARLTARFQIFNFNEFWDLWLFDTPCYHLGIVDAVEKRV
jgi:hypothetical protein